LGRVSPSGGTRPIGFALLFIVFWVAQTVDRARVPRAAPEAV
jgi:hypothetical protein